MADNNATEPTGTEPSDQQAAQPTVEELQAQLEAMTAERDKAVEQSRKWEGRSKSNAEKAKAYDELAAKSMTAEERAEAAAKRADDAESKLAEYEEKAQFAKDAAEVSEKYGVPASLLTERDRDAMEAQAKAIKEYASGQPTAPVFTADGTKPGPAKQTPQQQFANLFGQLAQ